MSSTNHPPLPWIRSHSFNFFRDFASTFPFSWVSPSRRAGQSCLFFFSAPCQIFLLALLATLELLDLAVFSPFIMLALLLALALAFVLALVRPEPEAQPEAQPEVHSEVRPGCGRSPKKRLGQARHAHAGEAVGLRPADGRR